MTYIFQHRRHKTAAILRSARTVKKVRDPTARQYTVYVLEPENGPRVELTGAELYRQYRQVQPTPRQARRNRYTSTRGQRRRELLGRRP
jgi:hypothetical protein